MRTANGTVKAHGFQTSHVSSDWHHRQYGSHVSNEEQLFSPENISQRFCNEHEMKSIGIKCWIRMITIP